MTAQDLKNSILQLAIQGKLVEQRVEEGTAKELLEQIKAEREQLIKEKKIKKEKPLPEITEEEIPFEIPENWEWVRVGYFTSVVTKGTTPRGGNVAYLNKGIGFLRAENVAGLDKLDKDNLKYIDEQTHNGILKRSIIEENDILITIAGTLGRTGLVRTEDLPLNANQAVSIVRMIDVTYLDLQYFIYALNAPQIQRILTGQKKVTAIPNLTLEIIANCVIPIPPLEEQKRIVTKIEEMLPYMQQYDKAYSKLEVFNKKFPEDMQKSILQYAIQGKLVEQRPEEGTAEELYQQIQEEKERLIKEGKIKKEKPLSEITEEEIPFEIPENWKWVRLKSLAILENGDRSSKYPKESDCISDGIPFFGARDMGAEYLKFDEVRYISRDKYNELGNGKLQEGDIVTLLRGSVGKIATFRENNENKTGFICAQMLIIRMVKLDLLSYISYVMKSPAYKNSIESKVTGTAVRQLPAEELGKILIPLPPLEEQKRIVQSIEELLPYCQQLIK